MNNTIRTILSRRSIRAYKEEQLKDDELNLILEAGKFAPSAINQQPWHFTVVQNKGILHRINEGCRNIIRNSPNKEFAKRAEAEDFSAFYHAPIVIIVSGDTKAMASQIDCSLALQNMFLVAESQNIGSCWINAIHQFLNSEEGKDLSNKLNIPDGYVPCCSGSFGYSAMGKPQAPQRKENTVTIIK